MKKIEKISMEYPFIMLIRILKNYQCISGIITKNGNYATVNKIRKHLNISSYRMEESLRVLSDYNLCRVIDINGHRLIVVNYKIRQMFSKGR